jgi:hypothetical protein
MYTSCVLGTRPSALFNEFFTYKKKASTIRNGIIKKMEHHLVV